MEGIHSGTTDQAVATRQLTTIQGFSNGNVYQNPQEGLVGPTPRVLDSGGLEGHPRVCISKLPGDADSAGPGTTLYNH